MPANDAWRLVLRKTYGLGVRQKGNLADRIMLAPVLAPSAHVSSEDSRLAYSLPARAIAITSIPRVSDRVSKRTTGAALASSIADRSTRTLSLRR